MLERKKKLNNLEIRNLKEFNLSRSLNFKIEWMEEGLMASDITIPLNIAIDDVSELEFEIEEYLKFLKETYVDEDPKNLDPEAKKLRLKLINLLNLGE